MVGRWLTKTNVPSLPGSESCRASVIDVSFPWRLAQSVILSPRLTAIASKLGLDRGESDRRAEKHADGHYEGRGRRGSNQGRKRSISGLKPLGSKEPEA